MFENVDVLISFANPRIIGFPTLDAFSFSKIQVPDFDVLNQIDGLQSAPSFKANIFSDGTVLWVIEGGLNSFCAFNGLAEIPFDTLGCQVLFGPHTRTWSSDIKYVLEVPLFVSFGAFDLTYNEWTPDPKRTTQGYTFSGDIIYYNIFFKRATHHYVHNIVVR